MNSQNESPFGNPRFVTSIIAVFIFLWGWQYYVNKKYPPLKPSKQEAQEAAHKGSVTVGAALPAPAIAKSNTSSGLSNDATPETQFNYEDEVVKWTLSSSGMGLDSMTLKTYLSTQKKPVIFYSAEKLFSTAIDNQKAHFLISRISDTNFTGTAVINGKKIKKSLNYNKEKMSFEVELAFEAPPETVTISTLEHKVATQSSNFLVPSFEVQNFLYKDAEKVKTVDIGNVKDEEKINSSASNVSLASVGTQYFTQGYVDKSEILPNIAMSLSGKEARLDIIYNLKNSNVTKLKGVIFIGPKSTEILKNIDPLLPEVLDLGMFGFIAKPLLTLMKLMYGVFGNWGLAIIALTIIMRFLMLPFNIVSFKSARAMQKIQPQLAAAREKYKGDPMAMNRETMALMKEHKANPLSSCLPMLIQIPIFFALWRTIGTSIEIYQQPFFGWITDLSSHDKFFVLPVLMGVTMYFQQKMTPTTMDPTQAKILNFMPALFSLFMISLPSGLTLYNFISALFGVTQQYFLLKDGKKS